VTEADVEGKTAYDIHLHAFNLSHPSLMAFVRRSVRELAKGLLRPRRIPLGLLVLASALGLVLLSVLLLLVCWLPPLRRLARRLIHALVRRVTRLLKSFANLLLVLENDIGSTFLLMENCLRESENPLLDAEGLHLGEECYRRIVLTPLMMDFGYKNKTAPGEQSRRWFHYDVPAGKPIVEQVVDVFRAIRVYAETESDLALAAKYPALDASTRRVFEIYPFLALNPANYTLEKIEGLLEKYFAHYTGRRADFLAQFAQFDGNIDHLADHVFAGIKVYPPLGFDPWPDDDPQAMVKIDRLYATCSEKGIPLITHGGKGGFVTVDRERLNAITDVSKWARALQRYPGLWIDLAHFPMGRLEQKRQQESLALVLEYENVYVDISCRATSDVYYQRLTKLLDRLPPEDAEKLRSRVLFGSDFAVNLMWIESYNRYFDLFSRTSALTPAEKDAFCSVNPERFLFRS
jgi:predicted TIM-barrel fold metal-dependent hydrolase